MKLKDIPGFTGIYGMSEDGSVFRLTGNTGKPLPKPKLIRQHRRKDGYCLSHLCKDNKVTTFLSHRLVWLTLKSEIPDGTEINHINGSREDNRPENLEVCSRSSNMLHKFRVLGRRSTTRPRQGEENHNAVLSADVVLSIRNRWESGETQTAIAASLGIHQTTVSDIVRRKRWAHLD